MTMIATPPPAPAAARPRPPPPPPLLLADVATRFAAPIAQLELLNSLAQKVHRCQNLGVMSGTRGVVLVNASRRKLYVVPANSGPL